MCQIAKLKAMTILKNRVAVVTGAGGGIGRALCVELAGRGADIAAVDINDDALAETAQQVQALGVRCSVYNCDVSQPDRIYELATAINGDLGRVDALFNNAGITWAGKFTDQERASFDRVIDIDLHAVIHGCRAFLPKLEQADRSYVVNMSSMLGHFGVPNQAAYSTAKAGVRGFTEALWGEYNGTGLSVTGVYPGTIRTNIIAAAEFTDAREKDMVQGLMARFGMPPEKAARIIVNAMLAGKRQVIVGPDGKLLVGLKRFVPGLLHWLFAFGTRRARASLNA